MRAAAATAIRVGPVPPAPAPRHRRPTLAALALLGITACGGAPPSEGPAPREPGARRVGTAIVLGSGIFAGRSSILQVLGDRITSLQVARRGTQCPEVIFRGRSSFQNPTSARVYVDGQEAVNTCVLEMVSTWDVERVEVYPSGIIRRPGYPVSGTGAILIFTKGRLQDLEPEETEAR
jgi:hypothetical protein